MMKKVYIVRDFDISYLDNSENKYGDFNLEEHLTNEYGKHEFEICATIPIFNKDKNITAYKFIFVRDADEFDELD